MPFLESLRRIFSNIQAKRREAVVSDDLRRDLEDLKDFADSQAVRYRPISLQEVVRSTKFSKREIQIIYRSFKENCPSGVVRRAELHEIFSSLFPHGDPTIYADYIFDTFDVDNSEYINFEEFVQGLSTISRGTIEEKIEWMYRLYDRHDTGQITWQELYKMIFAISFMMGHFALPTIDEKRLKLHTDDIFRRLDTDKDGVISKSDFFAACKHDETIISCVNHFHEVMSI